MFRLQQATAAQVVMLKAYLSSDHLTAATGKVIAITLSKNGGAFGNPNAGATNATEVSNGWYKITVDATDTAATGPLVVRGTAAATDDVELLCFVEPAVDLTSITTTLATIASYIDTEVAAIKAKTDQLTFTIANKVDASLQAATVAPTVGQRGGTVAVAAGVTAAQVLGAFTLPYRVAVTAAWATDHFILPADKLATQFTVDFDVPAPAGGSSFDWVEVQ